MWNCIGRKDRYVEYLLLLKEPFFVHQELEMVLVGPQAVFCCFRFFLFPVLLAALLPLLLVRYLSHEHLLCQNSSRENLNASKEQLCLEVFQLWLFTWEDSSCFLSESSSGCLDFPLLVLLNVSERNVLLYAILFLRVFGNDLFMSYG